MWGLLSSRAFATHDAGSYPRMVYRIVPMAGIESVGTKLENGDALW